jgi:DNA-binding MarR family transcriptional regulator
LRVTELDGLEIAPPAVEIETPAADTIPVTPAGELNDLERRAWRAFLRSHACIVRRLEADLMARHKLPLAEFDVLCALALADGQQLRMSELADRVMLSRAGITRLIDRLVTDGLVARDRCAVDARGAYAVLTERGRSRVEEVTPGHLDSVRTFFVGTFSETELARLAELLERVEKFDPDQAIGAEPGEAG